MKLHVLKTWPDMFEDTVSGRKQFEVRWNDRDFRIGDILILREWDPKTEKYSGREIARGVTYILHGGRFGLARGYVVLGILDDGVIPP